MTPSAIEASVTSARSFSWNSASSAILRSVMSWATPITLVVQPRALRTASAFSASQRTVPLGEMQRISIERSPPPLRERISARFSRS